MYVCITLYLIPILYVLCITFIEVTALVEKDLNAQMTEAYNSGHCNNGISNKGCDSNYWSLSLIV